MLSDTFLFELKVNHNASQRAKSAAAARARQRDAPAGGQGRPASREGLAQPAEPQATVHVRTMREIAEKLDANMKVTCQGIGLPIKFVKEPRLHTIARQMLAKMGTFGLVANQLEESVVRVIAQRQVTQLKAGFTLSSSAAKTAEQEGAPVFRAKEKESRVVDVRILEKICARLKEAGGAVQPMLEAMDSGGGGCVAVEDWCAGLELLGCSMGDAMQAWNLLEVEEGSSGVPVVILALAMEARLAPPSCGSPSSRSRLLKRRPTTLSFGRL
uniref:Uncharacterized protein n=1 Tax=Zooxanthella nutricula TaxID=1333877 RepID=A0A7S2KRM1_9DINO